MSKIEITSSNIDKFIKRFHKVTDAKNNGKKLSESQETFAQSLGCNNYNELKKVLENEISSTVIKSTTCLQDNQIDLYKGIFIDNAENLLNYDFIITLRNTLKSKTDTMSQSELFYNQLLTLINHPKSKISSCIFKKNGFNYSFIFKSCYDDTFSYTFGDAPINEKNTTHHLAKLNGFSPLDADLLKVAFSNNELVTNINLDNRFEAIDFANDLYNYLKELRGVKKLYVFKFNKNDSVNNSYIFENDSLYKVCEAFISDTSYQSLSEITTDCNKSNFLKVTNIGFFNQMIDSIGGNLIIYYKNLDESNDYIMKKENFPKSP